MLKHIDSKIQEEINTSGVKVRVSFLDEPNPDFDNTYELILQTLMTGYEEKLRRQDSQNT